jgi:hypothetical protein
MVTRVSARAWSVTGDGRSLRERWAEATDELIKLGGQATGPMTETTLQDIQAEVRRRTPAPEFDPALAEASRELWSVAQRYATLHADLVQRRLRLERLCDTDSHRILNDITPEMLTLPPRVEEVIDRLFGRQQSHPYPVPGAISLPQFNSTTEYRQASRLMMAEVQALSDTAARINTVLQFESYRQEGKNQSLIFALASRIRALEDRIVKLEHPTPSKRGSRK